MADAGAPLQFGFVKFNVRDLALMASFYENALGLVRARTIEADTVTELILRPTAEDRGFCLVLCGYRDGREISVGAAHGALAFFVDDATATYERALRAGAAPLTAPFEVRGMTVAFALDPEGRELEFLSGAVPTSRL